MDSGATKKSCWAWIHLGKEQFWGFFWTTEKHWGSLLLCVFGGCPTAMYEPIAIPFGMWTRVGSKY